MTPPDQTMNISCDEELIIFSDDANAASMPAETVTIPPTADKASSPSRESSQPLSSQVGQERRNQT
jgi:hypothetical protein